MAKVKRPKILIVMILKLTGMETDTLNAVPVGLASYDISKPNPRSMNMTRILTHN